jgi:hypothetical protein
MKGRVRDGTGGGLVRIIWHLKQHLEKVRL